MSIYLKQLSIDDDTIIYNMLQNIGNNENEFKNPVRGMTYIEFKDWLKQQDEWSKEMNLPNGYVGQTIFWLYDNEVPVGIGKIRHKLTKDSRCCGGNIGYAISCNERGKGYGKQLIYLLKDKCLEMSIFERLLTVEKSNPISKYVIEKCGGKLIKENNKRWFFSI